jgi:integrase
VLTSNAGRSPVTRPGYGKGRRPANAGRKLPAEVLSESECLALLGACSRRGRAGVRDAALIVVLWRGGLRVGEALALRPADAQLDRGTLRILHGKGDHDRVVALDAQAVAVLERWLELRRSLDVPRGAPLFCTISHDPRPGRPLRDSCFREAIKNYARRAGIDKRVHPHGLRHTHATELAFENVPLPVIQDQLGHASLATTERYIRKLAPARRAELMQARTWGNVEAQVAGEPLPIDALAELVAAALARQGHSAVLPAA